MKLLMKKLEILKKSIKFRGGLLRHKNPSCDLEFTAAKDLRVTPAKVRVAAAKQNLVLFRIQSIEVGSNKRYPTSWYNNSTSHGSSSNVRPSHTPFEHLGRWTKDHLIANVIGDPSRSISTRKQLETDVMWCYFDAFLTSVEPKTFKQAIIELS
ncbi:hypothetical protein Tco_1038381 [Tanacetum coccineum]